MLMGPIITSLLFHYIDPSSQYNIPKFRNVSNIIDGIDTKWCGNHVLTIPTGCTVSLIK